MKTPLSYPDNLMLDVIVKDQHDSQISSLFLFFVVSVSHTYIHIHNIYIYIYIHTYTCIHIHTVPVKLISREKRTTKFQTGSE